MTSDFKSKESSEDSSGTIPTSSEKSPHDFKLDEDSRLAVIGGGPSGSFFAYFLLNMAERVGLDLHIDIFETRDFNSTGPPGCNMCGGIISETLVQTLATEGIELPHTVVQRGVDSYFLHMDVGSVRIETPLHEMRIAAVYRGGGPKGNTDLEWGSFDGHLLKLALYKGAQLVDDRVVGVRWPDGRPEIETRGGTIRSYDLIAVAVGVNSPTLKLFQELDLGYKPPETTKTYICEYFLGQDEVGKNLGSSMHTFLLDIPRLEFAAIVPKGSYATVCMLGYKIDKNLVQTFLKDPAVRKNFPQDWDADTTACQCSPRMNVSAATQPFGDRIVFLGDSGVSRLYKDGVGAAYRTAKAAARTALFEGVSSEDFKNQYWPTCKSLKNDNTIGKLIFLIVGKLQKIKLARRAILRMVAREQKKEGKNRRMSTVLWDMFTGSAPYKEVFFRTLHPFFLMSLSWNFAVELWPFKKRALVEEER
jgi:flavin-dependent dehydrogenase